MLLLTGALQAQLWDDVMNFFKVAKPVINIVEIKSFEIHDQLYHELAFTHWWNLVGSLSTLIHYIIGCQQTTFWSVKELSAWNYFRSSSLIATFRQKILSWRFTEFVCILFIKLLHKNTWFTYFTLGTCSLPADSF